MKVAIIGAGLIGKERIEAVQNISKLTNNDVKISSVFDINHDILEQVKEKYNVPIVYNLEDIGKDKPDWIFIVTPNNVVFDIAEKAFNIGANVLVEKPFGRTLFECDKIINLKPNHLKLNVGFNYRFFAGIEQAIKDTKDGKFGKLISVNMILGHGNAPGMEKSWRFKPENHGDCLTDLGVHLIDIILQLSNSDVSVEYAKTWKGFWNTGIDEEAHFIISNKEGTIFNSQTSLNRWKSTFRLEINGTEGYGIVENRGRSYGPQSYRCGKKWEWLSGKKQIDTELYIVTDNDCSDSFFKETASILGVKKILSISNACSYKEGRKIMKVLNNIQENL